MVWERCCMQVVVRKWKEISSFNGRKEIYLNIVAKPKKKSSQIQIKRREVKVGLEKEQSLFLYLLVKTKTTTKNNNKKKPKTIIVASWICRNYLRLRTRIMLLSFHRRWSWNLLPLLCPLCLLIEGTKWENTSTFSGCGFDFYQFMLVLGQACIKLIRWRSSNHIFILNRCLMKFIMNGLSFS